MLFLMTKNYKLFCNFILLIPTHHIIFKYGRIENSKTFVCWSRVYIRRLHDADASPFKFCL